MPLRGMSAEMMKAEEIKPKILDWILNEIRKNGRVEMIEAVNSGAFIGNCSQGTVSKYIDTWTSRAGMLRVDTIGEVEYLMLKEVQ